MSVQSLQQTVLSSYGSDSAMANTADLLATVGAVLTTNSVIILKATLSQGFDTLWPSEHFPSNTRQ